jgi:hypothetical protein
MIISSVQMNRLIDEKDSLRHRILNFTNKLFKKQKYFLLDIIPNACQVDTAHLKEEKHIKIIRRKERQIIL